jgi:CBS domain-containing membrane protein
MSSDGAQNPVSSKMRKVFVHASPEDDLLQTAWVMRLARVRHLAVLDDAKLVGVLSYRDVLEHQGSPTRESAADRCDALKSLHVSDVMRRAVHSIAPHASLGEAAQQLLLYKIGFLPVVSSEEGTQRMVGLLSESDLLAAAYVPHLDAQTLEPCAPSLYPSAKLVR